MTYLGRGQWRSADIIPAPLLRDIVRRDYYSHVGVGHELPQWVNLRSHVGHERQERIRVGQMGRPRGEQAPRDIRIGFRVTEQGARWLDSIRGDLTRSEYLRQLLAAAAAGRVKVDVRS